MRTTKIKNIFYPLSTPIQMKLGSWLLRLKKTLNSMVTKEMNHKMHRKSFAMSLRKVMHILTREICLLWTKTTLCTSLTGLVTPFGKTLLSYCGWKHRSTTLVNIQMQEIKYSFTQVEGRKRINHWGIKCYQRLIMGRGCQCVWRWSSG